MAWNPSIVDTDILAVHAALAPTGVEGEVIILGGDEHWRDQQEPGGDFRKTQLYDVASHSVIDATIPSPDSDIFCAHHAFAADGRLLIAGGTQKWPEDDGHGHGLDFLGHRRCWIYNHAQRSWREIAKLNPNPNQLDEPHSGGRWYPGLVTLGDGDVIAFFGHPDQQDGRHRNTLPERYRLSSGLWANLPKVMGTLGEPNSGGRRYLFFPRCFVLPDGKLFFATGMPADFLGSTEGAHFSTAYDPVTGDYVAPRAVEPPGEYAGWDRPCVMLPLLPEENYRVRIVHVGGVSPVRIDLGETTPAWQAAGARDPALAGRDRRFAQAVLLPNGQVCVVGGVSVTEPEDPVLQTEIYDPGIDWTTASYSGGQSWAVKESGVHARNYHASALLLPNGKVFVAGGNTNGSSGDPDGDIVVSGVTKKRGIKKIELYEPDYISVANRIVITTSPRFARYGESFKVTIDRAATNIRYACLVRNSSVTHSTNNDQRFVGLEIRSRDGNSLTLAAPPHGNIAPPGHYMLWLMDNDNNPCVKAPFIRLGHVGCTIITDRSTFSREEVAALGGGGGQATFTNAVYIQYDGFIHTELTDSPTIEAVWADNNEAVDPADFELVPAGRLQEIEPGFADTTQRITFPFHVRFFNLDAYAGFTDRRQIRITATLAGLSCTETLDLTYAPNPYMIDINPAENNPAWLSTDIRVFSMLTGTQRFGVTQADGQPIAFIRACLDRFNDPATDSNALFNGLSTSAQLDLWSAYPWPISLNIYNYAIVRVRYRATSTIAQRVKCFIRMFNVATTALNYDAATGYRNTGAGPNATPLLGHAGGDIASIPFFATDRVETLAGSPGATAMTGQVLTPGYEIRDIAPNASGAEVTAYFGVWLDINQTRKRFPISPGSSDGPWPEDQCRSIQELVRGEHMCLVSEIFFEPDPTAQGETPGSSDNLSQRNLAFLHSDNPGGPDSRTIMHTLELKPSEIPNLPIGLTFGDSVSLTAANFVAAGRRGFSIDQLLIRWRSLPRDSRVRIYFSDIDTADIARLASLRRSAPGFAIIDRHTIELTPAGATWIPLPGGRQTNIPALLSIELPESVRYGSEYAISVHQVSGNRNKIIGSCEFRIPISKAELILDRASRTLSVFRHVLATIPEGDRWKNLMTRYVGHMGRRVDALGGDSTVIHPNPDGSGRPYNPSSGPVGGPGEDGVSGEHPGSTKTRFRGQVSDLVYDCGGRFVSFTLCHCDQRRRFKVECGAFEELILRACRDRLALEVAFAGERIVEVKVVCC